MQNSFKKLYDIVKLSDGSFSLTYRRKNRFFNSRMNGIASILLAGSTLGILNTISGDRLFNNAFQISLIGWCVTAFLMYYFFAKKLVWRDAEIIIKPSIGISFDGKTIPALDLKTIEVRPTDRDNGHVLIASSYGRDIIIAGPVNGENLGRAIMDEIARTLLIPPNS
jgi:hypothetical protein